MTMLQGNYLQKQAVNWVGLWASLQIPVTSVIQEQAGQLISFCPKLLKRLALNVSNLGGYPVLSNQGQLITSPRSLDKKYRLLISPAESMNPSLELGEIWGMGCHLWVRESSRMRLALQAGNHSSTPLPSYHEGAVSVPL